MTIELRHLRAFITIAEVGSYRKAAERLRVAQPALSRTIQQLESALEVRLFDRTTRMVQATEAGRHLLLEGRSLLAMLERTEEDVRRIAAGRRGELGVGFNDFTISEILPPLVSRFRAEYPDVRVILRSERSAALVEQVADGRLDIGFVSGVQAGAGLESVTVREETFVAVVPRGHPLARRARLDVADLAKQPFVAGAPGWEAFWNVVVGFCGRAGFTPNVAQTALHSDGIINFVAAGLGVTIYVDRHWLRRRDDVVVRPFRGPLPSYRSLAVWRGRPRSASLEGFLDLMLAGSGSSRDRLGDAPAHQRQKRPIVPASTSVT
jgi:DNA-binding transcriptional LysR family regulator